MLGRVTERRLARFELIEKPRERRYTSEDQKLDHPDDRGFEYVPALQDMPIFWGRLSPEQQAARQQQQLAAQQAAAAANAERLAAAGAP